jgi:hypothetical protein
MSQFDHAVSKSERDEAENREGGCGGGSGESEA